MTTALPDASAGLVVTDPQQQQQHVYGTFEVSLINLEDATRNGATGPAGANEQRYQQHLRSANAVDKSSDDDETRRCSLCSQDDCCFVMAFLCAPLRLQTYKVLVFHIASFAFALVAAVWTLALLSAKLLARVCCGAQSWGLGARRLESASLRSLLRTDTALFNFVSPLHERVAVYSSSTTAFQDVNLFFGFHAQLYFGVVKLVCSALPGVIAASMFVWSLQRLGLIALCVVASRRHSDSASCDAALFAPPDDSSSVTAHFLTTAAQDLDVLVLLGVLAVYGATMLLKVFAYIARHVTIFFCAEHLLYAAPV